MDVFYTGSTSQPTCFFGSLATSVSSQRQEGILVRYLMHASNARIAPHRHHQSQSLPQPPPPTSVNSSSWLSTVAAACWTRTFIHRGLQSNQYLRLYSPQLIQRAVALALIYIHSSPMLQHSQCHYKYQRQHYRWAPLHSPLEPVLSDPSAIALSRTTLYIVALRLLNCRSYLTAVDSIIRLPFTFAILYCPPADPPCHYVFARCV